MSGFRQRYVVLLAALCALVVIAAVGEAVRSNDGPAGVTTGTTGTTAPSGDVPAGVSPLTVAAAGDTMMGSPPYGVPPDDGAGVFAGVPRGALRADVSLVNLEGTLSEGAGSKCGEDSESCFAFQTPPAFAPRLKEAGFTVANLANNHSNDFGPDGRDQTVAALTGAGLQVTGLAGTTTLIRVKDHTVAVLGFAPYEWADPLLDTAAAAERVRQADARADLVIVTFHGGAEGADAATTPQGSEEYLGEPRGDARAFTHAVVDAGADLVIGHGPHVLRGMEVYRDRLIAHSLGNFVGYGGAFSLSGPLSQSMVLRATLAGDGRFLRGRIIPIELSDEGLPFAGGAAIDTVRRLSEQDFPSGTPAISADGVVRPAPAPPPSSTSTEAAGTPQDGVSG